MGIFSLQILRKWKYSFIWNVCLYLRFSHIHLRAPGNWKYSFIWDFRLYLGFSPFPLVNGQQRNQGGSDRRTDEPDPPTFHGPKGFSSAFHGIFQIVSYYISTFYRLYQTLNRYILFVFWAKSSIVLTHQVENNRLGNYKTFYVCQIINTI